MNAYPLNADVRVRCTFTTNSVDTDPSTVVCKVRMPSGTITTYTYGVDNALVRESTGIYHVDVSVSTAGIWSYRFVSTGIAQAANEARFYVQESDFGING